MAQLRWFCSRFGIGVGFYFHQVSNDFNKVFVPSLELGNLISFNNEQAIYHSHVCDAFHE